MTQNPRNKLIYKEDFQVVVAATHLIRAMAVAEFGGFYFDNDFYLDEWAKISYIEYQDDKFLLNGVFAAQKERPLTYFFGSIAFNYKNQEGKNNMLVQWKRFDLNAVYEIKTQAQALTLLGLDILVITKLLDGLRFVPSTLVIREPN
ncbi:UNKNOWN [Stylonychia lemnae]|uniref:Uncharacterized protein n=1 Tax=Stylonychia lemnae TaxID=5949 RepID=A0A078AID1_STYLE|nr:UNKNOWN [Stylonychia lemnae]|eukprot:CDW81701.1 UNKNOWN [Stylonychia lemnae]